MNTLSLAPCDAVRRALLPTLALLAALLLPLHSAQAFDLQGHRGARGLAPENTLAGFAQALRIGVHTLETDIAISSDGVLLISHNPALNPDITRGPDGQWLAASGPVIFHTPAAALQRYDVGRLKPGARYASQFPDQQAVDGQGLPTLDALLALVQRAGNPQLRLALETKLSPLAPDDTAAPEPFARALVAAVRGAGLASRTSILSFDWRTLVVVQREAPEINTVYLTARQRWLDNVGTGPATPWTAGIALQDQGSVPKMVHAAGGKTWSSFHGDLTKAQVQEAQALGIQVLAWTVNEPAQIDAMLDLGVDGIVSDRPDRVRTAMAKRGLPLPPALNVQP